MAECGQGLVVDEWDVAVQVAVAGRGVDDVELSAEPLRFESGVLHAGCARGGVVDADDDPRGGGGSHVGSFPVP